MSRLLSLLESSYMRSASKKSFPVRRLSYVIRRSGASEPLEEHTQGGYHSVVLGEFYDSGRYKVLKKLGWGTRSTVWLVEDILYVYWFLSMI